MRNDQYLGSAYEERLTKTEEWVECEQNFKKSGLKAYSTFRYLSVEKGKRKKDFKEGIC